MEQVKKEALRMRRWISGLWIMPLVILADRLTKAYAERLGARAPLIPGVIGLYPVRNQGIAFGLLGGHPALAAGLPLALMLLGAWGLTRLRLGPMSRTGALLAAGGAASNLADRLTVGYVTDMLEVQFVRFAVFNAADVCVCAGIGLMMLSLLIRPGEWERREHGDGL